MNDTGAALQAVVLIPAFNPGVPLLETVEALASQGFRDFVIVDDGSHPDSEWVFERLAARPECAVLRHATNLRTSDGAWRTPQASACERGIDCRAATLSEGLDRFGFG